MSVAVRRIAALGLIAALTVFAWPWLKDAMFVAQLLLDEPAALLRIPVDGVSRRAIVDTFGSPRPGDRRHEGLDIFAPRGTPVVSTTRGIVWRIGDNALGGTVVWVLGPGGQLHYYAHLDRVADIRAHQRVAPGERLGYVGNTGNAAKTAPHLHYGIYRRSGGAINPYPLLGGSPSDRRTPADAAG
jgi:murein DD-endopeptidase MepM/ murein hydrolase activator NlpD